MALAGRPPDLDSPRAKLVAEGADRWLVLEQGNLHEHSMPTQDRTHARAATARGDRQFFRPFWHEHGTSARGDIIRPTKQFARHGNTGRVNRMIVLRKGRTVKKITKTARADGSSRYHATLQKSANSYPLATDALMRADRHRPRRWQQFIDDIDLKAIDSLLEYLIAVSRSLTEASETCDLDFLPDRIADDVRISLEGLLSGYLQIPSDAMRDIIETELLIRDFAFDPSRIDRWRNANEHVLRKEFRPVHLRKRQADVLGVDTKDVPGATDYSAHSQLLHVGSPPLFTRTPESGAMAGHEAIHVLISLGDIMHHGSSAVEALGLLLNAISESRPDPAETLAALDAASEDLELALSAVEALERIIAERLSEDGNLETTLFESGLIIVFNEDTGKMSTYMIDRIDFRILHRSASDDQPASFTLTLLHDYEDAEEDPNL